MTWSSSLRRCRMSDVMFLLLAIVFFLLSLAFVRLLERLR